MCVYVGAKEELERKTKQKDTNNLPQIVSWLIRGSALLRQYEQKSYVLAIKIVGFCFCVCLKETNNRK